MPKKAYRLGEGVGLYILLWITIKFTTDQKVLLKLLKETTVDFDQLIIFIVEMIKIYD